MNYESIRRKIRRKYILITAKIRKKGIYNNDFTIISNNCWAGFIYQSYGLAYNTPTIGMFFMADDYLKFVKNLKAYIEAELVFINPSTSRYILQHAGNQNINYPLGKLQLENGESIELHFLHYSSEKEAAEKWEKRKKRVNWDKLLIKFNDQNGATDEMIKDFCQLPFEHKVCFTSKKNNYMGVSYYIKSRRNSEGVEFSHEPFGRSRILNINNLINSL